MIHYTRPQTYCTYTHISTKIPPRGHHTPLHAHTILHTRILLHNHLHKISPRAHQTPLYTHIIIRIKILVHQPFTYTIKYYTYKKLSQSPHLPEIHCSTLKMCCNRKTSHNRTRNPCAHQEKYKSCDMNTWYTSKN